MLSGFTRGEPGPDGDYARAQQSQETSQSLEQSTVQRHQQKRPQNQRRKRVYWTQHV